MSLLIPASVGELIDKITILEIKQRRIADASKQQHIRQELEALLAVVQQHALGYPVGALAELGQQLALVNQNLWQIEDDIRDCERSNDFGPHFIALARAVYRTNDERAALKGRINAVSGSALVEEKSYAAY
jgi:hypothetical protein